MKKNKGSVKETGNEDEEEQDDGDSDDDEGDDKVILYSLYCIGEIFSGIILWADYSVGIIWFGHNLVGAWLVEENLVDNFYWGNYVSF